VARSPVLTGSRLHLLPFGPEHLTERYAGWLNDPEVTRYSEQARCHHTLESCRAYAASFEGTPNYFWAAVCADPQLSHIGNLAAIVDPADRVADLRILIGEKRVWGQGYGREAFALACGYLLGAGGMRKVAAGTLAVNRGMLAIMRAIGMQEDGVRRSHALHDGAPVDIHYAALFADEAAG
jgi:ribosomal-protein-alanine N-acetyltransferase